MTTSVLALWLHIAFASLAVPGLTAVGDLDTLSELGIPTKEQYIGFYLDYSGTSHEAPPPMPFYVSFVMFRMASILQGVYKRAISGQFGRFVIVFFLSEQ